MSGALKNSTWCIVSALTIWLMYTGDQEARERSRLQPWWPWRVQGAGWTWEGTRRIPAEGTWVQRWLQGGLQRVSAVLLIHESAEISCASRHGRANGEMVHSIQ
jgi:hypothetical protein